MSESVSDERISSRSVRLSETAIFVASRNRHTTPRRRAMPPSAYLFGTSHVIIYAIGGLDPSLKQAQRQSATTRPTTNTTKAAHYYLLDLTHRPSSLPFSFISTNK